VSDNSANYHMTTHEIGTLISVRVNPNDPFSSIYRAPVSVLWGSKPIRKL